MNTILCLLRKELIQVLRDYRLFSILILAPMIQLLILGFAASTDVRDIALAVRDLDHSHQSREYVRALSSSQYFQTVFLSGPDAEENDLLIRGKAGLILKIPPGFGSDIELGRPVKVQAIVDGADSNFAVHGVNYLQKVTRLFSSWLQRDGRAQMEAQGLSWPSVVVESRAWYNPRLLSRLYMVPGMMGTLLMITTMVVTSMALVKEREEGTMEQLLVTPLRPAELIAGKLLPFVVIGFVEISLVVPVMVTVFQVPFRGSLLLLYGFSGLFFLTTLGLGLFISTLVKNQQQAMILSSFFVLMPFSLLSGFIFPIENMPVTFQKVTRIIPLRYYLRIVRSIFLKGGDFQELWPDALALLIWGLGILTLACLKFKKRLD